MVKKTDMLGLIKTRIQEAVGGLSSQFRIKGGDKRRIRFLTDVEEAIRIIYHDKWQEFAVPCLKHYGEDCPYCNGEGTRTRDNFIWTIWDYEAKKKLIFMFKANDSTPIPHMIAAYDNYGTICDRDYVVARKGEGFATSYTLMPSDKSKFLGKKINPFTEDEILEMLLESAKLPQEIGEELTKKKKITKKETEEEDEDLFEDEDERFEEEIEEEEEAEEDEEIEEEPKKLGKKTSGRSLKDSLKKKFGKK